MAHSVAGKMRISQSLIGNTHRLGYKVSDKTKLKQSASLKGKPAWNKGKCLSESTRKKMSLTRKGIIQPWMHRSPSKMTKGKLAEASKKSKDTIRQNKIIDILKPKKFWRYDAMNKQFRDVLKGQIGK